MVTTLAAVDCAQNNSYNPSNVVHQLHRIPHLSGQLTKVSNTFDLTVKTRPWNSYTHSLVPFPLIIASFGAAFVIVLLSFVVCRSCGLLSKHWLPYDIEDYADEIFLMQRARRSDGLDHALSHRRLIIRCFLACLLTILVCNQGIFLGTNRFNSAVNTFDVSWGIVKATFADLTSQGEDLEAAGLRIGENLAAALPTCPPASNTLPVLEEYEDAVDDYLYIVSPIRERWVVALRCGAVLCCAVLCILLIFATCSLPTHPFIQ
jgi:hypothetical protein